MKNKITTNILVVSAMTALASVATAQAVRAGAVAQSVLPPPAATPAVPATPAIPPAPAVPATPAIPPTPTVSAGTAAGASSGSAASVRTPVVPSGATSAIRGQGHANVDASSSGVNANATTHASSEGKANGLAVAAVATDETRTTVRMDETVKAIHDASFAARDRVNGEVEARVEASTKLVGRLQDRAEAAGEKSRAAFARALAEVRQREQEVRANLRAAAKATGDNWGKIQSELAQSYGAYAKAVAEAELAAGTK